MTTNQQHQIIAEFLKDKFRIHLGGSDDEPELLGVTWNDTHQTVNWPTETLHICQLATERLPQELVLSVRRIATSDLWAVLVVNESFTKELAYVKNQSLPDAWLEAVCRVLKPELFK